MEQCEIFFNGNRISDNFIINEIHRNIKPDVKNELKKIGTTSGKYFISTTKNESTIEIDFTFVKNIIKKTRSLADMLDSSEPSILTFSDEPNLYYLAIVDGEIAKDDKRFFAYGTIKFLIPDGVAYAIDEKKASDPLKISNKGTYKTYPRLEVEMASDNGYLGFINERGKILQFGNPEEIDGVTHEESQFDVIDICGVNFDEDKFKANGWELNEGPGLAFMTIPCEKVGALKYEKYLVDYGEWKGSEFWNFHPSNYGTGAKYHGPAMTRPISPDTNGDLTAKNYTFEITTKMISGAVAETGIQMWLLSDSDYQKATGFVFAKRSLSTNITDCYLIIQGDVVYSYSFDAGIGNKSTGWSGGEFKLQKFGDKFTATFPTSKKEFTVSKAENDEMKYVTVYMGAFGTNPPMTVNFMQRVRFQKHNVPVWTDIPNKFGSFDKLIVDTATGEVLLNGIDAQDLGAIGNDYDNFFLDKGDSNAIHLYHSSFAKEPKFDVIYREVYL